MQKMNTIIKTVKSTKILGIRIDQLSKTEVKKKVEGFLHSKSFHHIATVNPEFLVEAQKNNQFKKILNTTALNVCDGFGITLWTKILYKKEIPRITGVELAELICKLAEKNKKSVYFLGGFGVAKKAAKTMKTQFPKLIIAGSEDGNKTKLNKKIIQSKPDIILVAFGAPAQEFWIKKFHKDIPSLRLAIGIGGTFDFWAGKVARAPQLMQRLGLEWCWRLILQPKTRGKRIYNAVMKFSALTLKEKFYK